MTGQINSNSSPHLNQILNRRSEIEDSEERFEEVGRPKRQATLQTFESSDIGTLPLEVLLKIIEELPPADIANLKLVARGINRFVNSEVFRLWAKNSHPPVEMLALVRSCDHSQLTSLTIANRYLLPWTETTCDNLSAVTHRLESLVLGELSDYPFYLPTDLKALVLTGGRKQNDAEDVLDNSELLASVQHLECGSLELSENNSFFEYLNPSIIKLQISIQSLDQFVRLEPLASFINLVSLTIFEKSGLVRADILSIVDALPTLTSFNYIINGNPGPTEDATLHYVDNESMKLEKKSDGRHLTLNHLDLLNYVTIFNTACTKTISSLTIHDLPQCEENPLLFSQLTQLKTVHLSSLLNYAKRTADASLLIFYKHITSFSQTPSLASIHVTYPTKFKKMFKGSANLAVKNSQMPLTVKIN